MPNMIESVYIVHKDGIPLLNVSLGESKGERSSAHVNLFGGLSSVVKTLLVELGHSDFNTVAINGVLVYSSIDPFLFIVHTPDSKYERFAQLLVKQIEYEFQRVYNGCVSDSASISDGEIFKPFEAKIRDIYNTMVAFQSDHPEILQFIPSFIPLFRLNEALNMGTDIIQGFPHDTIKLVRQLSVFFSDDVGLDDIIGLTLGRYSGYKIARQRFPHELIISHEHVLALLNEVSVSKFDVTDETYDILLCPICREKTSDRPMCFFFCGFIEGALNNPKLSVEEIACRATGADHCQFKIHRN